MIYPYGPIGGEPAVEIKLSESDDNVWSIGRTKKQFDGWNWTPRLKSGRVWLHFKGTNPLSEEHVEMIDNLTTAINPSKVSVEVNGRELPYGPPEELDDVVDSYTILIDPSNDLDSDSLQSFSDRNRKKRDTTFLFKTQVHSDEDKILPITENYTIYDDDVMLFPKGRKVETVSDSMKKCYTIGKRNMWKVSPRLDVIGEYEEDDE